MNYDTQYYGHKQQKQLLHGLVCVVEPHPLYTDRTSLKPPSSCTNIIHDWRNCSWNILRITPLFHEKERVRAV